MDNYQIISRKYRPQSFHDVVGQSAIIQTLINALKRGHLAQAYLFCGSRGTGKTTLARILAKALNCKHLREECEPCNVCTSCMEIAISRSLDVIEIDGASNRGIDDIRKLNETVGYAPSSGKYKIYIIDEVHMLTKEAFNALLKTLEEPPKNTKFFFATTEPHKVLPTIMSRCQRFDLKRLSLTAIQEKIHKVLEDMAVQMNADAVYQLAELADGSLRDAESLLDQLICYGQSPITLELLEHCFGLPAQSDLFELDKAIEESRLNFAFDYAQKLYDSGKDLLVFMDSLLEHFRHLLLLKLGKEPSFLPEDLRAPYKKSADRFTKDQCLYILDVLIEWQQHFAKSTTKRTLLEMVLISLLRSRQRISIDTLVKRLSELEGPQTPKPSRYDLKIEARHEEIEQTRAEAKLETKPADILPPAAEEKKVHPSKYDTLIRFAAVELEGTIQQPRG